MDLIITIALVYFAYRGYQWYTRMQDQVSQGPPPNPNIDITPPEEAESDDYIDYEEVK